MDAAQALADLTEISSQIQAAVLFDESGAVQGSTLADDGAAEALADGPAPACSSAPRGFRGAKASVDAARGLDRRGQRLRRPRRRPADRRDHRPDADGRARVLRPEERAARRRRRAASKPKRPRKKKADDEA